MDEMKRSRRYRLAWLLAALVIGTAGCGAGTESGAGVPGDQSAGPDPIAGSGGVAVLTWEPNAEPDLLGYRIYVGLAPRTYDLAIDVGNVTTFTVTSLREGSHYFFAVTGYDLSGNESDYSNEVSKDVM